MSDLDKDYFLSAECSTQWVSCIIEGKHRTLTEIFEESVKTLSEMWGVPPEDVRIISFNDIS